MTEKSILAQLRKQLTQTAASEHEVLADAGGAKLLWDQIQDLRREMNVAKKEAADAAAAPYMEMIAKAERRYALLVKLSSS